MNATMSVAALPAAKLFANVGLLVVASVKKTPFRLPINVSPAAAVLVAVFGTCRAWSPGSPQLTAFASLCLRLTREVRPCLL